MPLQPGTTLGPYRVTAKIGEGGMGEVYQARDTKLNRQVALKILPEAFALAVLACNVLNQTTELAPACVHDGTKCGSPKVHVGTEIS